MPMQSGRRGTFVVSVALLLAIVASAATRPTLWRCDGPKMARRRAVRIIGSGVSVVADDDWDSCHIDAAPFASVRISHDAIGMVECSGTHTDGSNAHAWVENTTSVEARAGLGWHVALECGRWPPGAAPGVGEQEVGLPPALSGVVHLTSVAHHIVGAGGGVFALCPPAPLSLRPERLPAKDWVRSEHGGLTSGRSDAQVVAGMGVGTVGGHKNTK